MNKYDELNIELNLITKKKLIFSSFFILQNRMQTLFDSYFDDVTSKQWLIMIIVSALPTPPSLSEVASHAGCSRQNVKKIAAVLEKKGFIEFISDNETRAVRIILTQKFYDFYKEFSKKSVEGVEKIFAGMDETQIENLLKSFNTIEENINKFSEDI